MFYDQNQSRIIMSYPALLAAYQDAGDLNTEPARNALGLYLVHEDQPAYDQRTHTLALDGVELVGGVYHARYQLVPLTPEEIEAARKARVPRSCQRRQGRLVLLQAGYLGAVESAIAAIEDPVQKMAAQIEYEADTWERDNAFVQSMWAQLGGTPDQLDDLFTLAVTL